MSLLRAFIAIELPSHVCEAIQKQTTRLRQTLGNDIIRWVPTENMHLTLKFLGDTSTSHLDFLKQMLVREADLHPQFDMQLGGVGSFPNQRNPRLLWIGIHAPASLVSLQRGLESGASRLGYKPEERAFSPHLTIGRVRQTAGLSDLQKIRTVLGTLQLGNIAFSRVDSVHLFKSDLQPGAPVYTKLFSAPLAKA
ncbi:RNA 2',3'-cyclic phosphodiesterase [Anaerolineae bacterium]|nr:RNA 2',3'-cyclic phosphodiesterase [Anaerolineae bacterium]